jgi:hypothetical protein
MQKSFTIHFGWSNIITLTAKKIIYVNRSYFMLEQKSLWSQLGFIELTENVKKLFTFILLKEPNLSRI